MRELLYWGSYFKSWKKSLCVLWSLGAGAAAVALPANTFGILLLSGVYEWSMLS